VTFMAEAMKKQASKLKLRYYGDPCLRKRSAAVKEVGVGERMLVRAMVDAMHEFKGVGLAAPQVGVNQQIFVADIGAGPIAVINPKIIRRYGAAYLEEGCLSIPEVIVNVKRPERIIVRYRDEDNEICEREYSDLMARVFLHETDHLHGKLIVDHASLVEKVKLRKQLKSLERKYNAR